MKTIYLLILSYLVCACASSNKGADNTGTSPVTQFSNAKTIEEIRQLKPQAKLPLNIAIVGSRYRWNSLSENERDVIEAWSLKLKEMGYAKNIQLIPQSLLPSCGYQQENDCYFNGARIAGARMHADVIMFLDDNTSTNYYTNAASILNITLIGMWLVPAHHRDTYSVYEATLIDINNGYLYGIAQGRGKSKIARPYMYADRDSYREAARVAALNDLGEKLLAMAKNQIL